MPLTLGTFLWYNLIDCRFFPNFHTPTRLGQLFIMKKLNKKKQKHLQMSPGYFASKNILRFALNLKGSARTYGKHLRLSDRPQSFMQNKKLQHWLMPDRMSTHVNPWSLYNRLIPWVNVEEHLSNIEHLLIKKFSNLWTPTMYRFFFLCKERGTVRAKYVFILLNQFGFLLWKALLRWRRHSRGCNQLDFMILYG